MQNFKKIIVVGGLIYKKSQMLACRRSPNKDQAGLWEVPGGKVEDDESFVQALMRELQEELQLDVVVQDHIATSNVHLPKKSLHIVMHVFACCISNHIKGHRITSTDHDAIQWIEPDDIFERQWAVADVPILEDFRTFLEAQKEI